MSADSNELMTLKTFSFLFFLMVSTVTQVHVVPVVRNLNLERIIVIGKLIPLLKNRLGESFFLRGKSLACSFFYIRLKRQSFRKLQ